MTSIKVITEDDLGNSFKPEGTKYTINNATLYHANNNLKLSSFNTIAIDGKLAEREAILSNLKSKFNSLNSKFNNFDDKAVLGCLGIDPNTPKIDKGNLFQHLDINSTVDAYPEIELDSEQQFASIGLLNNKLTIPDASYLINADNKIIVANPELTNVAAITKKSVTETTVTLNSNLAHIPELIIQPIFSDKDSNFEITNSTHYDEMVKKSSEDSNTPKLIFITYNDLLTATTSNATLIKNTFISQDLNIVDKRKFLSSNGIYFKFDATNKILSTKLYGTEIKFNAPTWATSCYIFIGMSYKTPPLNPIVPQNNWAVIGLNKQNLSNYNYKNDEFYPPIVASGTEQLKYSFHTQNGFEIVDCSSSDNTADNVFLTYVHPIENTRLCNFNYKNSLPNPAGIVLTIGETNEENIEYDSSLSLDSNVQEQMDKFTDLGDFSTFALFWSSSDPTIVTKRYSGGNIDDVYNLTFSNSTEGDLFKLNSVSGTQQNIINEGQNFSLEIREIKNTQDETTALIIKNLHSKVECEVTHKDGSIFRNNILCTFTLPRTNLRILSPKEV